MRVNIYAEEMTDRIELVDKVIDGQQFIGLRFYLELPVTLPARIVKDNGDQEIGFSSICEGAKEHVVGPFIHHEGDDDSSAVTFWGKSDLRETLKIALAKLDAYYAARENR